MADVLPFPERNPRCATCVHWIVFHDSPSGFCEKKEEQTNSDYRCDEHKEVAK